MIRKINSYLDNMTESEMAWLVIKIAIVAIVATIVGLSISGCSARKFLERSGYVFEDESETETEEELSSEDEVTSEETVITSSTEKVRAAIREMEGYIPYAIPDGNGYTYGYGHLGAPYEGAYISEEDALNLFEQDILEYDESAYRFGLENGVNWSQNQFDAIVSFLFNMGQNKLHNLQEADRDLARYMVNQEFWNEQYFGNELREYCHATIDGERVELAGLKARRAFEARLFLYGDYSY